LGVEPAVLCIANEADDRAPWTPPVSHRVALPFQPRDTLADGILFREQPVGERLVDDHDPAGLVSIGRRERTSKEKRNSRCVEEFRAGAAPLGARRRFANSE